MDICPCYSCVSMGGRDFVDKLADFSMGLCRLCFLCPPKFFHYSMKQYVINQFHFYGTFIAGDNFDIHDNSSVNFYQGQPLTTNTPTASTANVEEVTPIVEHAPCPFLVPEKLTELGLYTPEQFESMFREAAESDAKTLATFLKKYRQMGVLDFKGKDKKQIFAELRACFPTMKRYSYSNFIYYF